MKSQNYERNVAVIKALDDACCDFDKEHKVEHHLYCYSESDYLAACELGQRKGYKVINEGKYQDEEEVLWQLDLVKPIKPTLTNVEQQSIELELIANEVSADYDGWGTEVEK